MRRSGLAVALGTALAVAGCGGQVKPDAQRGADLQNGKQLFVEKCGSCHILQDAATAGQVGPDLDGAFRRSRQEGFADSTLFEVTLDQIDLAAPPMPSDLVQGQDAVDVAAYVASVAGKPPQAQSQEAQQAGTTGAATTETATGSG